MAPSFLLFVAAECGGLVTGKGVSRPECGAAISGIPSLTVGALNEVAALSMAGRLGHTFIECHPAW
jgi:hypothetical protein